MLKGPADREVWSLLGAIRDYFELSVEQIITEYKELDIPTREEMSKLLAKEGYFIAPDMMSIPPNNIEKAKADDDGPTYDDSKFFEDYVAGSVPKVKITETDGYRVGDLHPAVKAA